MLSEEFLNIFGADSLRGIIDKYDIEYNGDRRKKSDMIAAIARDEDLSVGAVISNMSTPSLNDLAKEFGFRATASGRDDLINLFCLYFDDLDNVDDDFIERVGGGDLPKAAMDFLGSSEYSEDDEREDAGFVLASSPSSRQGAPKNQGHSAPVINDDADGFDAYYWFLRAPGKVILWVEYFFPKNGQLWASARRKGNETVEVLYSLGFWAVAAFLIFVLVNRR